MAAEERAGISDKVECFVMICIYFNVAGWQGEIKIKRGQV